MSTPHGRSRPPTEQGPYGQQDSRRQEDPGGQQRPSSPGPHAPHPGGPYGEYVPAPGRPRSYLGGGPVGPGEAADKGLRHIFTYRGRASRSAYWWFFLAQVVTYAVYEAVVQNTPTAIAVIFGIVLGIATIAMALAGIAVTVRRLHDIDRTGWWWWIGFVPFVGWIVLLIFVLLPGTPGPNRYG